MRHVFFLSLIAGVLGSQAFTAGCGSSSSNGPATDAGRDTSADSPADTAQDQSADVADGGGSGDASDSGVPDATSDATGDATSDTSDAATGDAADVFVPPVPSDLKDRVGVYSWGFDDTQFPGSGNRLAWAAAKVSGLGSRTIRVYLGPQDIYKLGNLPNPYTLAASANAGAYHDLFANTAFNTYLITTYSPSDANNDWVDGYTETEYAAERTAISQLGVTLLSTFPNKKFILLNWEGDNAMSSYTHSSVAWQGFIDWTNSRAQGVADARNQVVSTTSALYSGVEFNALRNLSTGVACDTGDNKCVATMVFPSVGVDFYSYSSWQSMGQATTNAGIDTQLPADLSQALTYAKLGDPNVTPSRFIVGEFGSARESAEATGGATFGECGGMDRAIHTIQSATSWGAQHVVFWQIIDNQFPSPVTASDVVLTGFGLYKFNGPQSQTGKLFQTMYATQSFTPPAGNCPAINVGGVVANGTTSHQIHTGAAANIYGVFPGAPDAGVFDAGTGDVVHLVQAGLRYDVGAGSPIWYDSPAQINITVPTTLVAGYAIVYVTSPAGLDSNGEVITVTTN